MIRCFLLFFLVLSLFTACNKDKLIELQEYNDNTTEECQGKLMAARWYIVDSLEIHFIEQDSFVRKIRYNEMTLNENGEGVLDNFGIYENYFFKWSLQCDPDLFTTRTLVNIEDTTFNQSTPYFVRTYDVLINEVNYKKMKTVFFNDGLMRTYTNIWVINKL